MQVGQGRDKRKCHLISFRQSSSTSFSPAKIFCYTYNNNMGYVSIRAWVGIGIACQRKKTGVKGITNSARELNLERISGSLFCYFLIVLHVFFLVLILSQTLFSFIFISRRWHKLISIYGWTQVKMIYDADFGRPLCLNYISHPKLKLSVP